MTVFVSYARRDHDADSLRAIERIVSGLGAPYIDDLHHHRFGTDRREIVEHALSAARAFVGVLSPHYLRTPWTCREFETARARGIPMSALLPDGTLAQIDALRSAPVRDRAVPRLPACAVPPRALPAPRDRAYGRQVQPSISISTDVAADPHAVWALVSDLPGMGRFSPENLGGFWVNGAGGPAAGAEFRGTNRNGDLRWTTKVRVVACDPGRLFAFDVRTPFGVRVSRWSYEITPTGTGCRLTENWYRVGSWFIRRFMGPRVTGRKDRPGYNVLSIEHTLAAVKAYAESVTPVPEQRRG